MSVILPLVLYSNYYKIVDIIQLPTLLFTWILFINILEVPFLIQFKLDDVLSHINGICTIILGLYTPYILYNKRTHNFTFQNHLVWAVANLFNSFYKDSKYNKLVFMPTVYSILVRETELWVPLRVYSLAFTFMIVSNTYLTNIFTGTSLDKTLPKLTTDKYYKVSVCSIIINVLITLLLIKNGTNSTLLGSLINGFT